jgi:pimeloyl-ACP methyl ester carboxylesterase
MNRAFTPANRAFTPAHRGGAGPPLVCLHGFLDTWRTWELVLPALERHHDVLAVTLAGHAGGPPITGAISEFLLADSVERAMDAVGFRTAHIVGNSLGGYVALQVAMRGRARSVVALAPAGGWGRDDHTFRDLLRLQGALHWATKAAAAHADAILSSPEGRRRATQFITTNFEHIPRELLVHQLLGAASCPAARDLIDFALSADWQLDPLAITCPVRVLWGSEDRLLPWPAAAIRYRDEWLPAAEWIELPGIGHCPQLDTPAEAGELILGLTARG